MRSRDTTAPGRPPVSGIGGFLLAFPAAVLAQLLGWSVAPPVSITGLVLAALAAASIAAASTTVGALAAAVLCWAVYDGFSLNRFGELHLAEPDLRALVCVVAAALVLRALAGVARIATRTRSRADLPALRGPVRVSALTVRPQPGQHSGPRTGARP